MLATCHHHVALLAALASLAATTATAADFPLQRWLDEPDVKLVAVEFYADWCQPCKAAAPKWEALRRRYASQGLKLVVVNVTDKSAADRGCTELPWNPAVSLCDPAIGKRLGVKSLPEAFVWSWQGNLLVARGQHVDKIERVIRRYLADNPRVRVEATNLRGRPDAEMRGHIEAALGRSGKLTVVPDAEMRARLKRLRKASHKAARRDDQQCALGAEVSANSLLRVERFKGSLSLRVLDAVSGCLRATASVPWDSRGSARTADKAIFNLLARLKRTAVQMPPGGGAGRRAAVAESEKRDTGAADWNPEGDELAMVSFASEPAGAMVLIDNKPVCQTPCISDVSPGNHRVAMHKPKYVSRDEPARLQAGHKLSWRLMPDFATLTVTTEPAGVVVTVDGKSAPAGVALQLRPGPHKLAAEDKCHAAHRKTLNLKRGEARREVLRPVVKPAGLLVRAYDGRGSALSGAEVWVDGVRAGRVFKALKVAVCAKEAEVRHGKLGSTKVALSLVERKTSKVKVTLGSASGKAGIEWVRLPGGTFSMGSNAGDSDEKPVHRVTVSGFELAKSEVTFGQYAACVRAGACTSAHVDDGSCWVYNGGKWAQGKLPASFRGADQPAVCVDWGQAVAFSRWVGGRLPTEAQWEFAARSGGRAWAHPWGNEDASCQRAVLNNNGLGCGRNRTWPVCSKAAGHTRQGLCDMIGNVSEWVSDWHGAYSSGAQRDPKGPAGGSYRVLRGCSWRNAAAYCRAAFRDDLSPSYRGSYLGFRPTRSIP